MRVTVSKVRCLNQSSPFETKLEIPVRTDKKYLFMLSLYTSNLV